MMKGNRTRRSPSKYKNRDGKSLLMVLKVFLLGSEATGPQVAGRPRVGPGIQGCVQIR